MSSNYPGQPQNQGPGWGQQPQQYPVGYQQPQGQPGWVQPQPPKKGGVGKAFGFGCLGFVIVIIIFGAVLASNGGSPSSSSSSSSSQAASGPAQSSGTKKSSPPKVVKTSAQAFKDWVHANGMATEKAAVDHVTKVQGGDSNNGIADTADIYTSYTGDMFSKSSEGKLIASAFADYEKSRGLASANGLVTVYNAKGEMISNGNY